MMASDDDQRRERHDQRQRPTDEVDADMDLREMTQAVAQVARHAGRHALQEQVNPHDLSTTMVSPGETKFTSEVNTRLIRYTRARLSEIEPFQGFWEERPEDNQPGRGTGASAISTEPSISSATWPNGP